MERGPDQIVACLHCGSLSKHMTLFSANDFGVRVWTDGKQVAPMCPSLPTVVRCHSCKEFYWLTDAKRIGMVGGWSRKNYKIYPTWAAAKEIEEPTEDDYYTAIENGFAKDRQQEKELRILAWWRRNDAFRDINGDDELYDIYRSSAPAEWLNDDPFCEAQIETTTTSSEACKKNLKALTLLLDETDENDCVMKAEVHRELGEFESARKLLTRVNSSEYAEIVRQILLLCDTKDTCVRALQIRNS